MTKLIPICVAHGDGIGPEIMDATLSILKASGAPLEFHTIEIGKDVYLSGKSETGITPKAWDLLNQHRVLLKAPITTPQGKGYKSLNVAIRKRLGLYANVRPCMSFHPFIPTHFPDMDLVIIRENEEDLYAGIEYRQTHNTFQSLKIITRKGCENIIRYAFEFAHRTSRKKVTCMTKDNIMKMSDGLFHQVFDEIKVEFPHIEAEHYIIDIGTAMLASNPEQFDVVVTLNLYGDIISDVTAQISGSVGLGGSANIGKEHAMFEAIHGSAPDIAGKDVANPSGLLNGAIQMLVYLNLTDIAANIQNALLKTIEDGIHTADIAAQSDEHPKAVGTKEFAKQVIANLGNKPTQFNAVDLSAPTIKLEEPILKPHNQETEVKKLIGVDVFIDRHHIDPVELANERCTNVSDNISLQLISCRGLTLWPNDKPCNPPAELDFFCCRFLANDTLKGLEHKDIIALLDELNVRGIDFVKMEMLYSFADILGFTARQ